MAQDDEIDTEALQAQIDLSMLFTHELVSSWIKPSNKSSSHNQNLEAELKEYMRRPPRLGVGASVPESNPITSRETARLKGQLTGKGNKRTREDDREPSSKQASDDEGESRAGAIKKKARADPFSEPIGKKKNPFRINDTGPPKMADISPSANATAEENRVEAGAGEAGYVDEHPSIPVASSSGESPRKKKKRRQHPNGEDADASLINTASETQTAITVQAAHISAGNSGEASSLGSAMNSASAPNSPAKAQGHQATSLLVQSVLNLDGPIGEHDSGSEEVIDSSSISKKKRKRRKKKHQHQQEAT